MQGECGLAWTAQNLLQPGGVPVAVSTAWSMFGLTVHGQYDSQWWLTVHLRYGSQWWLICMGGLCCSQWMCVEHFWTDCDPAMWHPVVADLHGFVNAG
jgi:hypothetical protein